MNDKYIILTGATSGIGLATAKQLNNEGYNLILGNRNQEKSLLLKKQLQEANPKTIVDIIPLDLASLASIRNFAQIVKKKYEHIDVLINNAGVLMKSREMTAEGYEMTIGVNYLGTYFLTELLMEKLINGSPAKIVFLSSIVAKFGKCEIAEDYFLNDKKGFKPYCNSKLALLMYAKELQERYQDQLVVKAVHPGIVFTHIWKWKSNFGRGLEKIQRVIFKSPVQGARMPLILATSDDYDQEKHIFYSAKRKLKIPPQVLDADFRKRFIAFTKDLIS